MKEKVQKQQSIKQLQATIKDLTEALQRERADSLNIRRRHDEQTASLNTIIKASIITDLLPVIDNFHRSLRHVPKDLVNNDYTKGVQGIIKQFDLVLSQLGVEQIKTVGQHFNPVLHEAVGIEDGKGNIEVVCEELQSGYTVDSKVIRHAMVKVKKG